MDDNLEFTTWKSRLTCCWCSFSRAVSSASSSIGLSGWNQFWSTRGGIILGNSGTIMAAETRCSSRFFLSDFDSSESAVESREWSSKERKESWKENFFIEVLHLKVHFVREAQQVKNWTTEWTSNPGYWLTIQVSSFQFLISHIASETDTSSAAS